MAKIRVIDPKSLPWLGSAAGDVVLEGPDVEADVPMVEVAADAACTKVRYFHPGSETDLQLFESWVPAGDGAESHAHVEDEVIYVLEGELHLGRQRLGPGSSIYVPANTLYAFTAGPDGLRFLNFRARRDMTYMTKDAFLARRAEARGSAGDARAS